MLRKIVKLLGEQCDGTITLALFELDCGHEVFVREHVPGYNDKEAFCRYCGPAYQAAIPPDGGWPQGTRI